MKMKCWKLYRQEMLTTISIDIFRNLFSSPGGERLKSEITKRLEMMGRVEWLAAELVSIKCGAVYILSLRIIARREEVDGTRVREIGGR